MTATRIFIGLDTSLLDDDAFADARVFVEAEHGEVRIAGPFVDWAGYKVVREYDTQEQALAHAWDIARAPVMELDRLEYDHANWFKPAV